MESFDGGKPVHSARRGAQCDAIASGKRCNAADGPVFPTITRIITLIYLNKMADSFCPPPASACAYGAGHHCAQPSLLANKSYTVKCFHLSLMRSSPHSMNYEPFDALYWPTQPGEERRAMPSHPASFATTQIDLYEAPVFLHQPRKFFDSCASRKSLRRSMHRAFDDLIPQRTIRQTSEPFRIAHINHISLKVL